MESSGVGRLFTVLTSPVRTFASIARRPSWVAPLVVFVVLSIALGYVVHTKTDYRELTEWSLERRDAEIDEEQLDRIAEMQEKFGGVGTVAGGAFVVGIVFFVALLYWVGLRVAGGELGYMETLSVSLYGSMPAAVQLLLSTVVQLARPGTLDPETLSSRNFLASNLAFLASEDAGLVVTNLLASLDFFAFWALALLVVGFRIVGRVSTLGAAVVVGLVWLFGVALRLGIAAISAGGLG